MNSTAIRPVSVTAQGAADTVGVSKETIMREIRANRLGAKRVGRRIVIPYDELEAWLAAKPEVTY